jgi:hypothetical protein
MKKLLALSLTVATVALTMSTAVLADTNNFVSSPSATTAPTVETSVTESGAVVELTVTAYKDAESLPEEKQELFQKGYEAIVAASDVSELNEGLEDMAKEAGVESGELVISDMFDISMTDVTTDTDVQTGKVTVTLALDNLENFVALLHYNGSEWEIVEGATVNGDGTKLTFTAESFSPFAIVTHNGETEAPKTGSDFNWVAYAVGAVVLGGVAVFCFVESKRKAEKE